MDQHRKPSPAMDFANKAPIRGLILDMDGVIWRAAEPIGDLAAIFKTIASLGLRVVLATNNATHTPAQFIERLRNYGVEIENSQVVNSGQAAAAYLSELHPHGGPVYVVGESGLKHVLAESSFYEADEKVIAVVAGLDRSITYEKILTASKLIRAGAPFIGTNPDKTFPTPHGLVPGAGSIIASIEAASGRTPIIVGKPEPQLYRVALERLGTPPQETLVVGDRIETDIEGAQALNCQTCLVLSGVTTETVARAWQPAPDYITQDLTEMLRLLSA